MTSQTDQTPDLAALEALAEAATPGPWRCWNGFPLDGEAAELLDMHAINRIGPEDGGGILGGWSEDGDMYATRATAAYIAAADPATVLWLIREVKRLTRWKSEALPVMDGLQELGTALGLPLGERITGPAAVAAAERLAARAERAEAELASIRAAARPDRFRCCECCKTEHLAYTPDGATDDLIDDHTIACSICQHPERQSLAITPTRGPRPSVRDVIELRARAEKAEATIARVRALVADWQANGNSRPLGDRGADVWHHAALKLLTVLDGGEPE